MSTRASARSTSCTTSTSRSTRVRSPRWSGDNGAGKSTLVKCIIGIYTVDSGEILFEGEPVTIHSPKDAAALGIEVVYQDLALCDNLDIVQNMFLGRERTAPRLLDEAAMETSPAQTLDSLSVRTVKPVRQSVSEPLRRSAPDRGDRQGGAVELARSCILDEPTAALGVAQTRQVLDLVRRLADQGLGVVIISHNMVDVFEVADRIACLFLGRVAAQIPATSIGSEQVIELMTSGRSGDIGLARRPGPDVTV